METVLNEITTGIYHLSTYIPKAEFSFNNSRYAVTRTGDVNVRNVENAVCRALR